MSTELQHWLGRNRPPRVQITYDVETLGASVKLEIPFIGGIIGDFKGGPDADTPMSDRTFVEIDRDNFTSVMEKLEPQLQLSAKAPYLVSRTPEGTTYAPDPNKANAFPVQLAFETMDDFAPPSIIRQTDKLNALMQKRQSLSDLMAKLSTTPTMEQELASDAAPLVLTNAKTAVDQANTDLMDTTSGAQKVFNDAAEAVAKAEGSNSPNAAIVTNAKKAVAAAVGADANAGYQKAYAAVATPWSDYQAAKSDPAKANAAAVALQGAGNAAWNTALVLRDAMKTVAGIAAPYPSQPAGDKADAKTAVGKAQTAVNKFVGSAGTAALLGNSAVAVNRAP